MNSTVRGRASPKQTQMPGMVRILSNSARTALITTAAPWAPKPSPDVSSKKMDSRSAPCAVSS